MAKKPRMAEDHRELWRLYQVETQLLLVLVNGEAKVRGKKGYLPGTQGFFIQSSNCQRGSE